MSLGDPNSYTVDAALSRAAAVGLRVIRLDTRRHLGLRCPDCGASLTVPVEPWGPQWTERRIDEFRYQHQHRRRRRRKHREEER